MTIDQLKQLRADANAAVEVLKARKDDFDEAINWADLHCTETSWIVTDGGLLYARVLIEEADPGACEFQDAVENILSRRWLDVQVTTEW